MTLPPVIPCCFEGECWAHYDQEARGPCWGHVSAIDEDYQDDWELRSWVHGCEGHPNRWGPWFPPTQPNFEVRKDGDRYEKDNP